MPFGIKTASDVFQERLQEIFNIEGIEIYIDDILIYGKTKEEHDARLEQVLKIAQEKNIKFNSSKCLFGLKEIKYLGHTFNEEGIFIDDTKVEAINEMPSPGNKKDLQRFLGLITYVGRFIPNLSEETTLLRTLLKEKNSFVWDDKYEAAFQKLKRLISNAPCLEYFDNNGEITISVDASKAGLGAVLLQNDKPVAYASKAMTETQIKYAQIEKELLAVCFGTEKFYQYIYGRKFKVETDHKPLIPIFSKPLIDTPPRLQRMLLSLQKYDINLQYRPGRELIIADSLSRANSPEVYNPKITDLEYQICSVNIDWNINDNRLDELKQATSEDETLKSLSDFIANGWPTNRTHLNEDLKAYYQMRNEITEGDGLMFRNNKILIPTKMRQTILNSIHTGHLGINKSVEKARRAVYWPHRNDHIEKMVKDCEICQRHGNTKEKQPLIPHEIKYIPWYKIGVDIFELNQELYLLVIDYYSKYVELCTLYRNTTSANVIQN